MCWRATNPGRRVVGTPSRSAVVPGQGRSGIPIAVRRSPDRTPAADQWSARGQDFPQQADSARESPPDCVCVNHGPIPQSAAKHSQSRRKTAPHHLRRPMNWSMRSMRHPASVPPALVPVRDALPRNIVHSTAVCGDRRASGPINCRNQSAARLSSLNRLMLRPARSKVKSGSVRFNSTKRSNAVGCIPAIDQAMADFKQSMLYRRFRLLAFWRNRSKQSAATRGCP